MFCRADCSRRIRGEVQQSRTVAPGHEVRERSVRRRFLKRGIRRKNQNLVYCRIRPNMRSRWPAARRGPAPALGLCLGRPGPRALRATRRLAGRSASLIRQVSGAARSRLPRSRLSGIGACEERRGSGLRGSTRWRYCRAGTAVSAAEPEKPKSSGPPFRLRGGARAYRWRSPGRAEVRRCRTTARGPYW